MGNRIYINYDWKYSTEFSEDMCRLDYDDNSMENICLPHTNIELPFNYLDEQSYQFVCCYRKKLDVSSEWRDKKILLTFEAVAHIAKVYLNNQLVSIHENGYTAFTIDISDFLDYDGENVITVMADSREENNIPPFGNVIDYLTYGGIYREAYIEVKSPVYISDVFVKTSDVEKYEKQLSVDITLNVPINNANLRLSIFDKNEDSLFSTECFISGEKATINSSLSNVQNWDLNNPILYGLKVDLVENDVVLDNSNVRFGFRECMFKEDGFYLNGENIKLRGLNRHQSFPYYGYAMPKRMQWQDADILKHELGVNAVRTSHYPQSQYFIDRCDELGLLVFTEIPGWQHIGDETWQEIACKNVEEMVLQYRNHPSIILWGVRINESQDNDNLYLKTNKIAHALDSTRQTGGVRFLKKSSLLEDVYTYNDFLHNGKTKGVDDKRNVTKKFSAPYLVSEYNGHMFPTKTFDCEEHRLEHALRHACVLDALYEHDDIAGGFGWCMFDYNTHQDFGSGDRICYHGVLDMFRNPKLAASVYASQSNENIVMDISSSMDIGEHPAGYIGDLYAFANVDSIKLYKNNEFVKEFYPGKTKYKNLPHPPIIIDDFVGCLLEQKERFNHKSAEAIKESLFAVAKYGQNGLPLKYILKIGGVMVKEKMKFAEGLRLYYDYIGNWGGTVTTYKFEGIKNGKIVKTIEKKPVRKPVLVAAADTFLLEEDSCYDVTAIRISAQDENGNILPFFQEPIEIEVSGVIEVIGPKIISLKGGLGGTYVKTIGKSGNGTIVFKSANLDTISLSFRVTKN